MALNINLQHRRDTEYNWEISNPILADGELIIVQTAIDRKIKIGNGISHYKDLPFSDSTLISKIEEVKTNGLFSSVEFIPKENWTIDASKASCFVMDNKTYNLSAITFTFTGVPVGKGACFTLIITNGGSATVTWHRGTKWANGNIPELTNGVDIITFITMDGGNTWYGSPSIINATDPSTIQ
jgi:hypothetical protein